MDERELSDLMNFAIKFSKLLSFYNQENDLEGEASILLENNIEVLIIQISSINIEKLDEHFENLIAQTRLNKDYDKILRELYDLFDNVESWNKKTSTRARNTFSGSKWGFLRTLSSIVTFPTPSGVISKVKRSYFKVKFVNFDHFCSFFVCNS